MTSVEKLFFWGVTLYLVAAVPFYLFNSEFFYKCISVCESEGYDIVIQANWVGLKQPVCRCLSGFNRQEEYILLEKDKNEHKTS